MKIRPSLILALALITLILQVFLFKGPEIMGASPDMALFLVFLASFYSYPKYYARRSYEITPVAVIITNWLIGISKDILSQNAFGTMGFLYLMSGLLVSLARQITFRDDTIVQTVILLVITWFCYFLQGMGLSISYGNFGFWYVVGKSFLIALYTAFVGGILLIIIHRVYWWHQTRITMP